MCRCVKSSSATASPPDERGDGRQYHHDCGASDMPRFQDATGTDWHVELTIGELRRVREQLGLDLGKPTEVATNYGDGNTPLLTVLHYDLSLIGDMLSVVLEPQLAEHNIDGEALAKRLDGTTLRAARDALLDAIADFHSGMRNDHVPAIVRQERVARDAAVADATNRVERLDAAAAAHQAIEQAEVERSPAMHNEGESDE